MPSPKSKSNRTTRRLLKLASLGIAGLLAGLLIGLLRLAATNSTVATYPPHHHARISRHPPHPRPQTSPRPSPASNPGPTALLIHRSSQAQFDPGPTLTNYDFTGDRLSASSDSAHLAIQ